jgi:hypothetical protein
MDGLVPNNWMELELQKLYCSFTFLCKYIEALQGVISHYFEPFRILHKNKYGTIILQAENKVER